MEHIETIELDSSQSSIEFTSIPQDYDDLVIKFSLRSNRASELDVLFLRFNGDSGSNYPAIDLIGTGSSLINQGPSTRNKIQTYALNATNSTSNTFSSGEYYVSNYKSSTTKSISHDGTWENNATNSWAMIMANAYNNTSAITSAFFEPEFGTSFNAGSTISLYGVTAGGDGTVTSA